MPSKKRKNTTQQGLFTKRVKVSAYVRAQGQLPPRAANGQWKKKKSSKS